MWQPAGRVVHFSAMDVPSEIRRSFELFAAGRLDEAANVAGEVLAVSPEEPSAHRVLAGVFLRRGQLDQALESARRAWETCIPWPSWTH